MSLGAAARRILEAFAAAYPSSAHYRGGRRLRKAGWEQVFPDIGRTVDAKTEFLEAVEELCALGVLSARWKRFREGDDLEALYLEDPALLYRLAGGRAPEAVHAAMAAELDRPHWRSGRAAEAASILRPLLDGKHPLPAVDEGELRDIGALLGLEAGESGRWPLRALSVRLYNDSKRIERILPAADRLGRLVWGRPLSEDLGLSRSYPEVGLAFCGEIDLSGGGLLRLEGEAIGLPLAAVERIAAFRPRRPFRVLSIENKETFFAAQAAKFARAALAGPQAPGVHAAGFALLVYTAGHPNPACCTLLRRAAAAGGSLHHFGDLDPDGLLIVDEIENMSGAPVRPLGMSPEVYASYREFGYAIEPAGLARLDFVRHSALLPLRNLIAREGRGVEQEVIDLAVLETDAAKA